MINQAVMRKVAQRLPSPLKALAKIAYYRGQHWAHPDLKQIGTVQDLYYWVSDGNLDTLLVLQNYFSALYPQSETATDGKVTVYDADGAALGFKTFDLGVNCCAKFRVSALLEEFGVIPGAEFGTVEVHINIPDGVKELLKNLKPFYFWDRFYIAYTTNLGQTCFVHGVDKAHIYRDGRQNPTDWYKPSQEWDWVPEIPVNIDEYKKFSVIMVNRTSGTSEVTLTLSDTNDKSLSWSREIPAKGVRCFDLDSDMTASLNPTELRMRVTGMATQYGRPAVFKQFPNGAISAMHC